MLHLDIIINQIVVLIILGLIGYLAGRTGYLPENSGMYISKVVIKITAPALIMTTMSSYDFTSKTITDGLSISLYTFIFITFSFAAGSAVCRLLKLQGATANIYRVHSMFGNTAYLALPLLKSLFGDKGLVYAVFFVIAHDTLIWTLGVYMMNRHSGKEWKENLKHLVNANMISFAMGLFFAFTNLHHVIEASPAAKTVYTALYSTLNPLGNATLYLIMLFIGLTLAESKIGGLSGLLKKYPSLVLAFFKLLVIPAVAFIVLYLLGGFVDSFVKVIIVLELAMPCATMIPALAAQYGSDYRFAAENVVLSTLISLVTLPVTLYFLNFI